MNRDAHPHYATIYASILHSLPEAETPFPGDGPSRLNEANWKVDMRDAAPLILGVLLFILVVRVFLWTTNFCKNGHAWCGPLPTKLIPPRRSVCWTSLKDTKTGWDALPAL